MYSFLNLFTVSYKIFCRINGRRINFFNYFTRNRINNRKLFYLIIPELYPYCFLILIGRNNFHYISSCPECSPAEINIISYIMYFDKIPQKFFLRYIITFSQKNNLFCKLRWSTYTIDAAHAGYNYYIPSSFYKSRCGFKSQTVNFFVHREIFFYIQIVRYNISFRLIIVIITYKELYLVLGKKCFKLGI